MVRRILPMPFNHFAVARAIRVGRRHLLGLTPQETPWQSGGALRSSVNSENLSFLAFLHFDSRTSLSTSALSTTSLSASAKGL